jgi:hypothetical protein
VLPALISVVAAQAETFSFATTRVSTTDDNVQPTATETISGPIETSRACGQVAEFVRQSEFESPSVEAEVSRSPFWIVIHTSRLSEAGKIC